MNSYFLQRYHLLKYGIILEKVTIDVKFGDADADTYKHEPIDKLLDIWEKKRG